MSNINFKPWVGKNYKSGLFNGKKVLILGESHYCEKELALNGRCHPTCKKELMSECCFNQTKNVIEEIKNQDWRLRTFSNFERAVFGRIPSQEERVFFWDSVMFYNYLQYSQSGPTRPLEQDAEAYKQSEEAFKDILETYAPDYIIAWGVRLYDVIPGWNGKHSSIVIEDGGSANVWTYTIKDKRIPAMFIYHPAYGGFSWTEWHPYILKFLDLDGTNIPTWLSHKPIIAVNYEKRDAEAGAGDAEFLSLGRSTWDDESISAKIWRKSSEKWSRQSEEIPLWRLLDLAILLVATLKGKRSILGESIINESDDDFLRGMLKDDLELYKPRLEELYRLLK